MRLIVIALLCGGCFYNETSPLPEEFAACPAEDREAGIAAPTWFADVQPIVIAKCQGCHSAGGLGPFELGSYHQVANLRSLVRGAVEDRRMPPWQPSPCCTTYRWDRSLTEAERATVLRWFDDGMTLGSEADAPITEPPVTALPHVDLRAEMREPFTPEPKVGADELRCFLLDHEAIDRTRYITGFDFLPGVRSMVHHVIVFSVPEDAVAALSKDDGKDGRPGWDCYGEGGELQSSKEYIGGWQPGVLPRVLPEGIGRELKARTRVMIQIHYDTGHGTAPDRSAIELMLEDKVERIEKSIPVGNPLWFAGDGMAIPAGAPDTQVWFAYDPSALVTKGASVDIHNVMLHMHELGSIGRVAILRANGTTECLLDIPRWDFHWMADYYLDRPARLDPGDQLYVECHWDNTAENQKVVNGVRQKPRTLRWGTDQEMCGAVLTYSEALP
ncbi:hypothetical protein BH11MYX3_BH11MYX3_06190 [soil metagenome]